MSIAFTGFRQYHAGQNCLTIHTKKYIIFSSTTQARIRIPP